MDKKILLGGAAALLLVGNMYATPASASINLSIGGEAKLTASMNECGPAAAAATDGESLVEAISGADLTDGDNDGAEWLAAVKTNLNTTAANPTAGDEHNAQTHAAGPCAGADRSGIDWGFGKELAIDASGTLANGLEVSFSDTLDLTDTNAETGGFDLTLGGAFGSLQFKDGAPSAVDAAMVTGKKNHDVNGPNLGAHPTETSGSAGMGILWNAPSMGELDLYVGWAPNSGGDGLDTAAYENTFSIGAVMTVSGIEIGAGYEAASADATNGACGAVGTLAANMTAQALVNEVYGGDYCGDQTLMYIGANLEAGSISFDASYSVLDTDEADKTSMNIGAATTVSDIDVSIDYRSTEKDYEFGDAKDEQNVIAIGLGTSLGDGVDLGLSFSTSDVAQASTLTDDNYYFAEASLTVGF